MDTHFHLQPTTRKVQRRAAPIHSLPAEVVERIAAGEVIERPASVVRELIENALDAGATSIRIELREGGTRLIRVSDDGSGIAPSDLPLVCQPHTTSKISQFEDVARLTTLGFRGEALSSIAAVADVEIASADGDGGVGASIELARAGTAERRLVARERGTTVTTRHLLQAVPARLALLGTPAAERARCLAMIRLYACAHPAVRFTVLAEGELALHTPGTGLPDALTALYGADLAAGMIPFGVPTAGGMATIIGHLSARGHTYTTRDQTALTVNGRLVTNRALLAAAERGYRPLLRKGRHPVLLCHLTVPSDWVDVNVHPAKAEVLLRHEAEIARALREAVHAALGAAPAAAIEAPRPHATRFHVQPALRFPARRRSAGQPFGASASRLRETSAVYGAAGIAAPIEALAQLNDALILARGADGALYLVDQHRAHERILYEQIRAHESVAEAEDESAPTFAYDADPLAGDSGQPAEQFADDENTSLSVVFGYRKDRAASASVGHQLLLEPQLVELSPNQAALLAPRLHELAALGLECQPFGGQVFLVRSIPSLPGAAQSLAANVRELTLAATADSDDWLDALRASLACRAAIRRGLPLTPSEQQALLTDLAGVSAPAVCPHGSPLILAYSPEFLANAFEW